MVSEKEIQRDICKYLAKSPDCAWYTTVTSGLFRRGKFRYSIGKIFSRYLDGTDGLSDLVGMKTDGVTFLIEVKSETGRVSKEQQAVIDMVLDNNGLAGVARSIEDVEQILRGYEIKL